MIGKMSEEDKLYLVENASDPFIKMFFCMGIRKDYNLWHEEHPLTKDWSNDKSGNHIVDGVDYHPNHPDDVSNDIYLSIIKKLNTHR